MRLSTLCCWSIFLLALTASAQAPAQPQRTLTLMDCIQLAITHNLDVQIERYNPRVNLFNLQGSYGSYDPTYSISASDNFNSSPGGVTQQGIPIPSSDINYDIFGQHFSGVLPTGLNYDFAADMTYRRGGSIVNDAEYTGGASVTLTQPLLKNFWIDNARQTIAINKKTLKSSELALEFSLMNTVTKVEQTYYDLIFAYENVKVQESALELAQRLLAENKKRVEVGAMAPLDEKQAESQVAARRADLLAAQRDLAAQQNALKNLLTEDFLAWQAVKIEPADRLIALAGNFNLQDSWNRGVTARPDLAQLKVELEKRDIILRFRHNQLFPQLDLTGSYGLNSLGGRFGNYLGDIGDQDNP
ncbi:MAG: TolC family protein, partial [Pedosphaera parvula]|nr:TolC family protein [Pedosphaera parvula]